MIAGKTNCYWSSDVFSNVILGRGWSGKHWGASLKNFFQNGGPVLTIAVLHLYTPPPWGCGGRWLGVLAWEGAVHASRLPEGKPEKEVPMPVKKKATSKAKKKAPAKKKAAKKKK